MEFTDAAQPLAVLCCTAACAAFFIAESQSRRTANVLLWLGISLIAAAWVLLVVEL